MEDLANGWQGDDFDAFADQMETVFANCERITADIGDQSSGMVGLLNQKSDEIYALQGGDSHELPYPAPQYWVEDKGGLFSNPKVHVRTPFKSGDCEVAEGCMFGDGDAEKAMELGGFDGEYANELNQYKSDQTEFHLAQLKADNPDTDEASLRARAEQLAEQDANNRAAEDYDEASNDYEARATEQNETVIARWTDAESSASEFAPTVEDSKDTAFRDSGGDLTGNDYSPPGGGSFNGSPSSSGTGGLNPPESTSPFGGGSGGLGGGGGFTGGGSEFSGSGLDGNNPWASAAGDDPDDISGGLASSTGPGGGIGAGTGLGTGAGAGTGGGIGAGAGGAGMGSGGAMVGGAGGAGGRPGGMGAKAGTAGAAGRGMTGGMMGGGAGRGAGAGSEDEEGRATWLTEDDDVWGTDYDEETDPYV
ncbi:hypothetical protein [Glycomyces halotolerans]